MPFAPGPNTIGGRRIVTQNDSSASAAMRRSAESLLFPYCVSGAGTVSFVIVPVTFPYTLIELKNTNCFTPSRFACSATAYARSQLIFSYSAGVSFVSFRCTIAATCTIASAP